MKRCFLFSVWCMMFAVLFPAAVRRADPAEVIPPPAEAAETASPAPETAVRFLRDGEVTLMPLEEYLFGAVWLALANFLPALLHFKAGMLQYHRKQIRRYINHVCYH